MSTNATSTDPKDKTPEKWSGPKDGRELSGAGTYPNYNSHKTRSGHVFTMDDSDGAETVTLQHRGGSMVQFLPDGAVQFVSHNGQYNFVFGENRVHITGAYDVTVKGGGSLRVEGDYNHTVMGNHNMTVNGDYNMTAKNMNATIRGNMDTSAKNMTTKVQGSTEITTEGVTSIASHGGLSMSSSGESVSILGQGDLGIGATGKIMLHSGDTLDVKSGAAMRLGSDASIDVKADGILRTESGGQTSIKAGGIIGADGTNIYLNSGSSQSADSAKEMEINIPKPTNPNAEAGSSSGGTSVA